MSLLFKDTNVKLPNNRNQAVKYKYEYNKPAETNISKELKSF